MFFRKFATPALLALVAIAAPAGARVLQMQPMAATRAGETHSFLAVSSQPFGAGGTPYTFSGRLRTVKQLRTPTPNAWEVTWLVWNYVDKDHLYYFILKPNGWEIGKRDPRYAVPGVNDGQKIIATGSSLKGVIGQWYRFQVQVAGPRASISIDGVQVAQFHDKDTAPLLGGRVGLYGEDALCEWSDISAPFADSFEADAVTPLADGTQLANWRVEFLGYGSGGVVDAPPKLLLAGDAPRLARRRARSGT